MYVIISDIHIGDKHVHNNLYGLYKILQQYGNKDNHLILNGDIFDFSKSMKITKCHVRFIHNILNFGKITYIEGNHDWFISGFGNLFPKIQFTKHLKLIINNRRFHILHGHQVDFLASSWVGRLIVKYNGMIENFSKINYQRLFQKTYISKIFHQRLEEKLINIEKWADVIVAGHTHMPAGFKTTKNGKIYINTGDWIERKNCHYLIIQNDGDFELIPAFNHG